MMLITLQVTTEQTSESGAAVGFQFPLHVLHMQTIIFTTFSFSRSKVRNGYKKNELLLINCNHFNRIIIMEIDMMGIKIDV